MEDFLKRVRPSEPAPELRARILEAAQKELSAGLSVWDRLWASKAFWISAAATIVIGLVLPHTFSVRPAAIIKVPEPRPEAVQAAKELSEMMGDGALLQERFAAQLSGPLKTNGNEKDKIEDWIERG